MVLEPAEVDEDVAIKSSWGRNIDDQMTFLDIANKQLVQELAAIGTHVTVQTVSAWRRGEKSPGPANMVAVARVLRIAPRVLFSLDVVRVGTKAA